MKFITLFAGALAATTAANIFLASDAHAFSPPNGWTEVGKRCQTPAANYKDGLATRDALNWMYKLAKTGTTLWGVYNGTYSEWVIKDVSVEEANAEMNSKCDVKTYKPT